MVMAPAAARKRCRRPDALLLGSGRERVAPAGAPERAASGRRRPCPVDTILEVVSAVPAIRYVKEETLPCGQRITALLNRASRGPPWRLRRRGRTLHRGRAAPRRPGHHAGGGADRGPCGRRARAPPGTTWRRHDESTTASCRCSPSGSVPHAHDEGGPEAARADRDRTRARAASGDGRAGPKELEDHARGGAGPADRRAEFRSVAIGRAGGGARHVPNRVERLECFVLTLPRREAYLGAPGPGEAVNDKGYFVRGRNGTVYPTFDRSVLVRATTNSGAVGWGETYGIVAPGAHGGDHRGSPGRYS